MNAELPNEETLLEQALTFTSTEARLAYLEGACGADEVLRARVLSLIEAHEATGGFLADKGAAAGSTGRLEPQPDERPGTVLGPYKLLQQIGEGGGGAVYMAGLILLFRFAVAALISRRNLLLENVVLRH